jgi:chorismate lyase/3-hydroxybenzoate synthase
MTKNNAIHIQYLSATQLEKYFNTFSEPVARPLLLLEHSYPFSISSATTSIAAAGLKGKILQLQSGLNAINAQKYELWTATGEWHQSQHIFSDQSKINYCFNNDYLIGNLSIELEPNHDLQQITEQYYEHLIHFSTQANKPHLMRMWNYLPGINQIDHNLERYQQFCLGRHNAFKQTTHYPAASAVGGTIGKNSDHHVIKMVIIFIATEQVGFFLENPNQISAYCFPRQYAPKSPSFARAAIYQGALSNELYISGTASIIGHASKFQGDVYRQTEQTLSNIKNLIQYTNTQANVKNIFTWDKTNVQPLSIKVYLRHRTDMAKISPLIHQFIPNCNNICYLQADICRQELDVEIEMMLSSLNSDGLTINL